MRTSLLLLLLVAIGCSSEDGSTNQGSTNDTTPGAGGTGAESRSTASTTGLGQTCPAAGCASGQTCMSNTGPEGTTETCEIKCEKESDCPTGTKCQLPPLLPDSIPNVCAK